MAHKVQTGEESIQDQMGSFGKYGATDVPRGESTNVDDLDHQDTPPESEG